MFKNFLSTKSLIKEQKLNAEKYASERDLIRCNYKALFKKDIAAQQTMMNTPGMGFCSNLSFAFDNL